MANRGQKRQRLDSSAIPQPFSSQGSNALAPPSYIPVGTDQGSDSYLCRLSRYISSLQSQSNPPGRWLHQERESFAVLDREAFLAGLYAGKKIPKWDSFVRQMNEYGFGKPRHAKRGQRNTDADHWVFFHPHFRESTTSEYIVKTGKQIWRAPLDSQAASLHLVSLNNVDTSAASRPARWADSLPSISQVLSMPVEQLSEPIARILERLEYHEDRLRREEEHIRKEQERIRNEKSELSHCRALLTSISSRLPKPVAQQKASWSEPGPSRAPAFAPAPTIHAEQGLLSNPNIPSNLAYAQAGHVHHSIQTTAGYQMQPELHNLDQYTGFLSEFSTTTSRLGGTVDTVPSSFPASQPMPQDYTTNLDYNYVDPRYLTTPGTTQYQTLETPPPLQSSRPVSMGATYVQPASPGSSPRSIYERIAQSLSFGRP